MNRKPSEGLPHDNFFLFQYVVVPTRRGTAEAIQILFSHLLGDAGSPYLIGVVSHSFSNRRKAIASFA